MSRFGLFVQDGLFGLPFRLVGAVIVWTCIAVAARGDPAMWVVRGPHATVYLFGTMHMLPRPATWFSPTVRAAFDRSEVLWEEADIGTGDPARMMQILGQAVSTTDLFTLLSPKYASKLRLELQKCGLPEVAVSHLQPWMAQMMPSLCAMMADSAQGHTTAPELGPEATLARAARGEKKATAYFETAEQQIGYLSSGSEHSQVLRLEQAIDEAASGLSSAFSQMETAWLSGDEAGLRVQVDQMRREDPAEYREIFVGRNARFAERIAEMARGHGTFFVAIGAGHLVGDDSVPAQLSKRGIAARRL